MKGSTLSLACRCSPSYDERIYATLLARDREQEALIGAGVGGEHGITTLREDRQKQTLSPQVDTDAAKLVDLLRCTLHIWTGWDAGPSQRPGASASHERPVVAVTARFTMVPGSL